ncbi:MAG: ABC transporter ATP-binding protein [Thermodesulfobacteriota bacterium]
MKAFSTLKEDFFKHRWNILIGLLALLIVDILQLLIPRIIKFAIDDLISGEVSLRGLSFYGMEIVILALGIGGFRYVWRYHLLGTARKIEKALRDRLFIHLQTLSLSYFFRSKVGDLMARALNDIEAIRMALALGIVFLADTLILGVLTLFFMVYIHPQLTLFSILPMPFITIITMLFSRLLNQRFEVLQKTFGQLTERIRESISGIRVVRAYVQEDWEQKKLSDLSRGYMEKNLKITRIWGLFFPILLFLSNLSLAIILYVGGKLTILQRISPGDLVAFMSYLGLLTWPMMALGWAINIIQRGKASMERVDRILREKPEITDPPNRMSLDSLKGRIEIKGLTFIQENERMPLLDNINLEICEGEKIAIVGGTGSGKSTLCRLMTRILDPPKDSIFYDGVEIHQIPLNVLRGSIGFVPQETFLFSDTIRENITFGRSDASEEKIKEVMRIAQLEEEILSFPNGLDTLVGEKGINLSGGQAQRIAIARTLLMNPKIFILDNALSSVDLQTEERILEGLENFLKGKTFILVTHRSFPLRRADRIFVLDGGRIAEMGDHQSLLEKGGIYTRLYFAKTLEEELESQP